ncbi:MAG: diphthine--ammonia ligase [Methanocellales archaeon]|nr:diphthine--ammonia ligase [Methanocellales archaeon]
MEKTESYHKKRFVSWSGGKESCLACYKAMQDDFVVSYLLNFMDKDGERSRAHGLRIELLRLQSDAIGIPIILKPTTWETYEQVFKNTVSELKQIGVEEGIFGDIDLQEHRDWVERVCAEVGIKPILPLWSKKRERVLEEFIRAGFEAIVVATKADFLGEEWLGCRVDRKFRRELSNKQIDLCGEAGEYHTFVIDGPIFRKRINILESAKVLRNGRWFLEITKLELDDKGLRGTKR